MHRIGNAFWNRDEGRMRALWRIIAQLLLLIIIAVVGYSVLRQVIGHPTVQGLYQLAMLAGSSLLAARWFDRRRPEELGLTMNRSWMIDFGFGALLGVVLMAGIFGSEYALGWIEVARSPGIDHVWTLLISFGGAVVLYVCVGIAEEVWTRGYLLTNLAEGMRIGYITARSSLVAALVVTSAVFGLMHGNNPSATLTSTINITLAGVMLGVPYILTGKLAIPIGLHITWNLFQGPVFGFPVSGYADHTTQIVAIQQGGPEWWTGGSFGPEAGGVGLVAMLAGTGTILGWIAWRNGGLGFHAPIALPPSGPQEAP